MQLKNLNIRFLNEFKPHSGYNRNMMKQKQKGMVLKKYFQSVYHWKFFIPCVLFLFSLVFRLSFLDKVPTSINGDELLYIMTSKSITLTGSDMTGTWYPLSLIFFNHPPNELQAELPYMLHLPFLKILPLSLFSARLPSVILGSLIPVCLYFITKKMINKRAGIIAGLLGAVNPWLVVSGRGAYEHTPAMFFYLSGITVFLYEKRWKMLWGLGLFVLAFYAYIGTKMIFLPLLFTTLLYSYFVIHKKTVHKASYATVIVIGIIFFSLFLFQMKKGAFGERTDSLFLPSSEDLTAEVQENRKSSIRTVFTYVFENKIALYGERMLQKTFNIFSPFYLFSSGDQFFSLYRHGVMYGIDALFVVAGIVSLYTVAAGTSLFLIAFIIISILPELFFTSNVSIFTPHVTLLFPALIILMALGIDTMITLSGKKKMYRIFVGTIVILYCLFITRFIHYYLFEYPIQGQSDFPKRIASRYIALEKSRPIDVYVDAPYDMMRKYMFYANAYSSENAFQMKDIIQSGKYQVGNVTFLSCNNTINPKDSSAVILYAHICGDLKNKTDFKTIKALKDGGEVFYIFNDTLCKKYRLTRFPEKLALKDFAVESLDEAPFCRAFISF